MFRSTGILHPSNINKPGAIACLCFRGIWYRTRFSAEHSESMLFSSCDEWLETYNTLCEDPQIVLFNQGKDRYFCNSRAYGQATGRNVKHARTYFNEEKSWLKLFEGKDSAFKLGYVEAFQFLQRKDTMGRKFLPELGALTGMLITADLVYAGKVMLPTVEEMGHMVYILKKGAVRCLQDFWLVGHIST